MIEPSLGNPTEPGIYAARQWYGWRILEWHKGAWWHIGRASSWPKKAEIDAFVGPLPVIARDFSVKEWETSVTGKVMEVVEEWEARLDWDGQAQYADDAAKEYDL
jgi:hypothetical protein